MNSPNDDELIFDRPVPEQLKHIDKAIAGREAQAAETVRGDRDNLSQRMLQIASIPNHAIQGLAMLGFWRAYRQRLIKEISESN